MTTIQQDYIRTIEDFYASNLLTVASKVEDYAEEGDPFSNFRFAALSAGITVEQVFLVLYGIKLARLKTLLVNNRTPNNESIEDTLMDDANYKAILAAYRHFKNSSHPAYDYAGQPSDDEVPPEVFEAEAVDNPLPEEDTSLSPVQQFMALFKSATKV